MDAVTPSEAVPGGGQMPKTPKTIEVFDNPNLIYFSSVSENTKRFMDKLALEALRIPLRPKIDGMIRVYQPYVLIVPSYGGGDEGGALPRQVASFLNDPQNRSLIRGVITSGNTNFGKDYCIAGKIISQKCRVPELYRFELLGTPRDIAKVREGLAKFWSDLASQSKSAAQQPLVAQCQPNIYKVERHVFS
jgi:protein involved in ribonucleotide reduction